MQKSKSVGFILAPAVHLYKKVMECVGSQEQTENTVENIPMQPQQSQQSQQQQPIKSDVETPIGSLKIEIPGGTITQPDGPTPPPYDASPLSPRSHQEIRRQRSQESETRKHAITEAFTNLPTSSTESPVSVTEHNSPMSPIGLLLGDQALR